MTPPVIKKKRNICKEDCRSMHSQELLRHFQYRKSVCYCYLQESSSNPFSIPEIIQEKNLTTHTFQSRSIFKEPSELLTNNWYLPGPVSIASRWSTQMYFSPKGNNTQSVLLWSNYELFISISEGKIQRSRVAQISPSNVGENPDLYLQRKRKERCLRLIDSRSEGCYILKIPQ